MAVHRWKFKDQATEITLEINPSEMDGPFGSRTITASATTAGRVLVTEGGFTPKSMNFSGKILTKDQYMTMVDWWVPSPNGSHDQRRITVTDHFGRALVVIPMTFDPKPERSPSHYWKHSFTATCMVLSVGSPTVDNEGNDL